MYTKGKYHGLRGRYLRDREFTYEDRQSMQQVRRIVSVMPFQKPQLLLPLLLYPSGVGGSLNSTSFHFTPATCGLCGVHYSKCSHSSPSSLPFKVHTREQPFEQESINALESASLATGLLTILCSLYLRTSYNDFTHTSLEAESVTAVAAIANILLGE